MIRPEVPGNVVMRDELATNTAASLAEAIETGSFEFQRVPYAKSDVPAWIIFKTDKIQFALNPFSHEFRVTPHELNPRGISRYYEIMKSRNAWDGTEIPLPQKVWAREKVLKSLIGVISKNIQDIPERHGFRKISELLEFGSGIGVFNVLGSDSTYDSLYKNLSPGGTRDGQLPINEHGVFHVGQKAGNHLALGIFENSKYGYSYPKQIRIFSNVNHAEIKRQEIRIFGRYDNPVHQTLIDYVLNAPDDVKGENVNSGESQCFEFDTGFITWLTINKKTAELLQRFELPNLPF